MFCVSVYALYKKKKNNIITELEQKNIIFYFYWIKAKEHIFYIYSGGLKF